MTVVGAALLLALVCLLWLLALSSLMLSRRPSCAPPRATTAHLVTHGRPMEVELLHSDPVVRLAHGFVSPEEASAIIEKYASLLERSTVASATDSTNNVPHPSRTSWSAFLPAGTFGGGEHDVIGAVEDRAVVMSGKPKEHMETLQLVRYEGGQNQFYQSHFDFFVNDVESQRTTTIFVYLNDTNGEGPTSFPRLGLEVKPRCGSACIWENYYIKGKTPTCDERLEHAGLAPKHATKYGLNIWFRTLPFRT